MSGQKLTLLETLDELNADQLDLFKWNLQQPENIVGNLRPLAEGKLEEANTRQKVVNLIMAKYPNDAQEIVMNALRKTGRNDLANDLENIPRVSGVERPQATGVDAPGKTAVSGVERPQATGVDAPGKTADPKIVTEKQLMQVANKIGKAWRRIGISLGISGHKLEQIEENHPRDHLDRVYQMLCLWKKQQRKNATAAHLHAKLAELDEDQPDDIDFLLEEGV